MDSLSVFFSGWKKVSVRKEEAEFSYFYTVSDVETWKALNEIEKGGIIEEILSVKDKCDLNDREKTYELNRLGWWVDVGIEGFSKEFELKEGNLRAVIGVSCMDGKVRIVIYKP
ncbi:hypothetical protein [Fervidicoccus fontis]|uniref:Uncharacterized protein n=1 Tax=Fervidicoccus fontis (strain DSM 19380 / JCM 18336 / VKM B-2539 / Kam940) TaxID=1163730 RepID=I0A123_FERFK|nr:hypothetical protein [Fervidicoccus fontis]AFH42680.1 hypothetical protein FFONT_0692 [Fervidicoccus fontis Kam940]